jgi:predicted DNA-binding mobile mystery protein A
MNKKNLLIKQMDERLKKLKKIKYSIPKDGWVKNIRKALGMSAQQLANRLNVDRSRVVRIEADENKSVLTMKTLRAVANALDCDFVYFLLPRKSLSKMLEQQAEKLAVLQLKKISHSMFLEKQNLPAREVKKQINELKIKLLESKIKNLWD